MKTNLKSILSIFYIVLAFLLLSCDQNKKCISNIVFYNRFFYKWKLSPLKKNRLISIKIKQHSYEKNCSIEVVGNRNYYLNEINNNVFCQVILANGQCVYVNNSDTSVLVMNSKLMKDWSMKQFYFENIFQYIDSAKKQEIIIDKNMTPD
ncbi:MAG: hypothetical protein N4A71_02060 [Carboxylicivirga sp.]|jgi:hypothetical protein|nr:hypothetical protein [Carboxylicivirga sp.]